MNLKWPIEVKRAYVSPNHEIVYYNVCNIKESYIIFDHNI